jgi:hypothetical protein
MLLLAAVAVMGLWVLTLRDVVQRVDLTRRRRVGWVIASALLPVPAVPLYWLIRPLRPSAPPVSAGRIESAQTLADLIPGWSPDRPGACDQATAWASSGSRVSPQASFYTWLRESGLAGRHPACAAKLVRALLGTERSSSFVACPQVRALTEVLSLSVKDGDDLRAIETQLRRLCPGMPAGRPASSTLRPV